MSKEVVTIGGGSGSPELNKSLLLTNKVEFIKAIAAVFDSGGATGRRRLNSEGREPAFSDAMRILFSLVKPGDQNIAFETLKSMFSDRDSRGRVLGQEIFKRYFDFTHGYRPIEEHFNRLGVKLSGTVIPSTTHSADISFKTASGRTHLGEHELDAKTMSKDQVVSMTLKPEVPAFSDAMNAIKKADIIFLSFGSLHGSLLCNFLPTGMQEAVTSSKAKIFLITNLVSTRNETHEITPLGYVELVRSYIRKNVDGIVIPRTTRKEFEYLHPQISKLYDLEHSHFLGWEESRLAALTRKGIAVIKHEATVVVEVEDDRSRILRHDPSKLAETLKRLL